MILLITLPMYEAAKKRGWIKSAGEIFPNCKSQRDNTKQYWMAGNIAPCEIELIQ